MSPESVAGSLWQGVLARIRERVSEQQFDTWFRGIQPGTCSEDVLELTVPNAFSREWLRKKYADLILGAVENVKGGRRPTLRIVVRGGGEADGGMPAGGERPSASVPEMVETNPTTGAVAPAGPSAAREGNAVARWPHPRPSLPVCRTEDATTDGAALNQEYRFKTFCVGAGNRLPYAAALAVVEKDTRIYNPLFIHGGVGFGKTHLLQAISHGLIERRPGLRVRYVSCEQFTNQFIAAVDRGEIEAFRSRFREIDALIMDDVQFLAQKDRTQEEFFHTFNTLYNVQKQIVVAADAPPGEIPGLSERLTSRFKWGLVCEIEAPCFDTRVGIVRRKAASLGQPLPEDVVLYIAEQVRTNIRELEGAVTRVIGYACLSGGVVDLELARQTLRDVIVERRCRVTMDHIARAVTSHFGVKLAELQGKRRTQAVAVPRQVCMFLSRRLTAHSLEEIGGYFGGRDHSTVLYGIERTQTRAKDDGEFRTLVEQLGAQSLSQAAS